MNAIKSFFEWIMGWVMTGVILVVIGFSVSMFTDEKNTDSNTTKVSSETKLSKDEKLIEVKKEYWENGNLKSEVPYRKHYGVGWKKVKTTLTPHGIAKEYYENGVLRKEDPYIDGERTGTLKIYSEEGALQGSIEYVNSRQHGKETWYYGDGSIMDVKYYKDGNETDSNV